MFENPSTWGDMNIEDIPMISTPSLNSKLIELRGKNVVGLTFGEAMDKVLLQFMIDKGVLPTDLTFIAKEV